VTKETSNRNRLDNFHAVDDAPEFTLNATEGKKKDVQLIQTKRLPGSSGLQQQILSECN
jgi:hypothetical protein